MVINQSADHGTLRSTQWSKRHSAVPFCPLNLINYSMKNLWRDLNIYSLLKQMNFKHEAHTLRDNLRIHSHMADFSSVWMESKSDLHIGIAYSKTNVLGIKDVPLRDNKIKTPQCYQSACKVHGTPSFIKNTVFIRLLHLVCNFE